MDAILVVDTGSQSMRGILFDRDGAIVFSKQIGYFMEIRGDAAEQDPADFENALVDICRETARFLREDKKGYRLAGIVLTSQRSSVIAVDEAGTPLHAAFMWYDKRSQSVCDLVNARHGDTLYHTCGILASPVMVAPKIAWVRKTMPELYDHSFKMITIHDYLLHLLTGRFLTDYSFAGRTCLFDIANRCWSDEMTALFGLDRDKLCEPCEPGSIAGTLTESFAGRSGLPCVPVITGGGDQQCAVLGQGLLETGDVSINTGTGAYVISVLASPVFDTPGRMNLGYSAIPGKWVLEANTLSSGSAYHWFNANFYPGRTDFDEIDREVASSPPGANGVVMLPDLAGKGCPDWDDNARGTFLGLSIAVSRADCARAVLEGIAAEIFQCYDMLEKIVFHGNLGGCRNVRSSGGLSKSGLFNQMLADMIGRPVEHGNFRELTAAGAWVNAAVALNFYDSHGEAYRAFSQGEKVRRFEPKPDETKVYRELLRIHRILEKSLPNGELARYQEKLAETVPPGHGKNA